MNIVWITWEKQRRSISLARELNADFVQITITSNALIRYTISTIITFNKIISNRRSIIIVQNPSIILTFFTTILRKYLSFKLIVDRHTDPYLLKIGTGFVYKLFSRISDYTIKNADLTIVTNSELGDIITVKHGKAFILPDPFPEVKSLVDSNNKVFPTGSSSSSSSSSCLVVSSWYYDEPIEEIFSAASQLTDIDFFITGKPKKSYANLIKYKPKNVYITNYLDDRDYYTLMNQCAYVIAITTDDATLVCGAYESIAMGKPFITGNSNALNSYFLDAGVYCDGTAADIVVSSRFIMNNYSDIQYRIRQFYEKTEKCWHKRFNKFKDELINL